MAVRPARRRSVPSSSPQGLMTSSLSPIWLERMSSNHPMSRLDELFPWNWTP
jgi:hypothetical protein